MEYLDGQTWAQTEAFATTELQIHRDIGAHGVSEPGERVGVVADPVCLVPPVALAQDELPILDPGRVGRMRAEDGARSRGAHRLVATEVVDVGVRVEDQIEA